MVCWRYIDQIVIVNYLSNLSYYAVCTVSDNPYSSRSESTGLAKAALIA